MIHIIVRSKNIKENIPDITNVATNRTHNAKINGVKNEIPSIIDFTTTALNAKINEGKNKISNITNLATTTALTALTALENKIPGHSKYITTPKSNKLTTENFAARLAQANLASKIYIANFRK